MSRAEAWWWIALSVLGVGSGCGETSGPAQPVVNLPSVPSEVDPVDDPPVGSAARGPGSPATGDRAGQTVMAPPRTAQVDAAVANPTVRHTESGTSQADVDASALDALPSDPGPPVPRATAAIAEAYAVLTRGDIGGVSQVLTELDRAAAQDPPDAHAMFYSGAFRLWKGAQGTTGIDDLLGLPALADEWLSRLTQARTLLPDDFRVTGFLCNAQLLVGSLRGDSALFTQGLATCDAAIAQFPAYGHFLRAAATGALASGDPNFTAFDDLVALAEACDYPDGDGEHRYRYPTDPADAPDPGVCLDEGIVAHNFEGVFIVFGDVALKAKGDPALARALYRSAQTAPNYASWPFAAELEARIEQADDRAARFHDFDPLNDPDVWSTKICVGCHQEQVAP